MEKYYTVYWWYGLERIEKKNVPESMLPSLLTANYDLDPQVIEQKGYINE